MLWWKRFIQELDYARSKEWTLKDVGLFWDKVSDYDDINEHTPSYFRRFIDGYRFAKLENDSYTLDICSRTGNGTLFFWEKGKIGKVVCADFSATMQEICIKRLRKKNIDFQARIIDSLPLPFNNEEFDSILCFETVEHVSNPADFINELARVMKKGGKMILTTPNILWEPVHSLSAILNIHHSEGPHKFIRKKKIIKYLIGAGFDITGMHTTVLVPAGPKLLVRIGEWIESKAANGLMPLVGLRNIFICEKRHSINREGLC